MLKARADLRVKSLYDHHRRSRAESTAAITGGTVVDDASTIWNDPEIQGVFVLSETNLHERDVLAACAAKKPVFVEKPLGLSGEDGFRMAQALEAAGVLFMTGYRTRSEGIFIFLRDQIRKGHFGKITRLRYITCAGGTLKSVFNPEGDFAWMRDPRQSGGGTFLDLGTHALDAVLWLMGERVVAATSVVGKVRALPEQGEDYGEGLLEFESGAIGSMAGAGVDVAQPVRCVISGTEGHAHVVNGQLFFKSSKVPGADGTVPWTDLPPNRPLVFDVFVNALQGTGPAEFITPHEAATVCAVQSAMSVGAKERRWVEPTERK